MIQQIKRMFPQVLTRTKAVKYLHWLPVYLHWLPVSYGVNLKVLLLIYKSVNSLGGPEYVNEMLIEYQPSTTQGSVDSGQVSGAQSLS